MRFDKDKNIYDEPEEFVYKLRNGQMVMPLLDKMTLDKYKVDKYEMCSLNYILTGGVNREYINLELDDYDWFNKYHKDLRYLIYSPIRVMNKDMFENPKEYDIIAFKHFNNFREGINLLFDYEENKTIEWDWECKGEEK